MISEYLKVEETVIPVSEIEQTVTLVHITDMHLTEVDERNDENTSGIAKDRTQLFKVFPGLSITEVFLDILAMSDALHAGCTVLSGDILDFPSQANIELLDSILNKPGREYLYITGNHDWCHCYIDGCPDRKPEYMQKLSPFMDIETKCAVKEIKGIKIIMLDDSDYQITPEQFEFFRCEVEQGKPCLLFMHIPMYLPSLAKDVISVWKNPIMLGIPDSLPHNGLPAIDSPAANETTRAFYRYVTKEAGENLYGVFAGHVHFNHQDSYRINRFQYVTAPGFSGICRKITLIPL